MAIVLISEIKREGQTPSSQNKNAIAPILTMDTIKRQASYSLCGGGIHKIV